MAQVRKTETETELQCNPQNFFEMMKSSLHNLPAIFPDVYKEVRIVKGDIKSIGCVRLFKYVLPGSSNVQTLKGETTELDEKNMTIGVTVVEGYVRTLYKHMLLRVRIVPKGKGSLVKWTVEYEKQNDQVPDPDIYLAVLGKLGKVLDAHLLKA